MAKTSRAPATVCAEHIALSSFFYQVPVPVVRNALNLSFEQGDHVLPFSKERRLTEDLAFLAKTKDGWNHIPAVCVEQNSLGTILNVILAINKSTYADGDDLLQNLKSRFEDIFHVLHDSKYGLSLPMCILGWTLTIFRSCRQVQGPKGDFCVNHLDVLTAGIMPVATRAEGNQEARSRSTKRGHIWYSTD